MSFFKKIDLPSLCCKLSIYSYKNKNNLLETFSSINENDILSDFTTPSFYSSGLDAQCFITTYRNKFFVVFRGTESNQDILTNINFIPTNMREINTNNKIPLVHRGFLQQFRSLKDYIEIEFNNFISNYNQTISYNNDLTDFSESHNIQETPEIIFTGYSLGGALATISSIYFSFKYYNQNISCFTYGSPRVGNSDFVDLFNMFVSNNYRYVNELDPVCNLPFTGGSLFKHVSPMIFLDKQGKLKETNNNSISSIFKYSCIGCNCFNNNPFKYHNSDYYYEKLLRLSI